MFYRLQPDPDEDYLKFVVEGLCKLYDPSHRKTYTLEDGITNRGSKFAGARIFESKYGWVLFQNRASWFLCCPFTSEAIDLPELERRATLATFSSNPTSAGCVFFAFSGHSISFCRRGDRAWRTIKVLGSVTESYSLRAVAYSNGSFYCLFDHGELGAFNVATEQWDLLFRERWGFSHHLFESDGQLFSVQIPITFGCHERRPEFRISRFDFSSRNWVQGVSPGHGAAFTLAGGKNLSMFIPAAGEATQLAGTMNMIYSGATGLQHYSFKTNEYLPQLDVYSEATFSEEIGSVWIQPPN